LTDQRLGGGDLPIKGSFTKAGSHKMRLAKIAKRRKERGGNAGRESVKTPRRKK